MTETKTLKTKDFTAEDFVESLLTEGAVVSCDETTDDFNKNALPEFYDEELYIKGQKFFYKNIFVLFASKLMGLLVVLSVPSIRKILHHTNMSNSNMTAYRRYLSTIFHMVVWYDSDFKPGSRLWQSIANVKKRHNSASKNSCSAGLHRISQKDMALTQFGFMGFALSRPEAIGLYHVSDEEFKAFVHLWRVVGCLMGIEDRFNICRESVEETKQICKLLVDKVFRPGFDEKDKTFLEMSSYLINGLWSMNPMLNFKVFMTMLYNVILSTSNSNNNNNNAVAENYMELSWSETMYMKFLLFTLWTLKFSVFRLYHNYVQIFSLWLMKVFPFLGYYQFGKANSHVSILNESKYK